LALAGLSLLARLSLHRTLEPDHHPLLGPVLALVNQNGRFVLDEAAEVGLPSRLLVRADRPGRALPPLLLPGGKRGRGATGAARARRLMRNACDLTLFY